jgi:flagellar P-ring protein precursor FlgI
VIFDRAMTHRPTRHRDIHSRHQFSDRTALRIGILAIVAVIVSALFATPAQAMRLKEVAAVQGVRSNQLIAMLQQLGVTLPAGTTMQLKNVAAVIVTASLPAFAQPGQQIDIDVSSVANAKSLRGGTLVATPLKGADGQVYAIAQGNMIVGGAGAAAGGSKVTINHLSAGRIPEGATVERSVPTPLSQGDTLQLDLNSADYATARAVAQAINASKGAGIAHAVDGRVVTVKAPLDPDARVGFMADIENLDIAMQPAAAKIVMNARTGSIVMNQAVTLNPCAVAHGSLSVTINSNPQVSQPAPNSGGQTVVTDKTDIAISQQAGSIVNMPAGTKLADVVKALNALGATPQDLLAILQAMKASGALTADIEVI